MSQPDGRNEVDEERVDVDSVPGRPGDVGYDLPPDDLPPAESGGVGIGGDSVPDTFEPEERK